MRTALLALGILVMGAAPGVALTASENPPGGDDRHMTKDADASEVHGNMNGTMSAGNTQAFVKKAGVAGMAEVAMGKLGSQKATDPAVKSFAQKMVMDHTKANTELASAAKSRGLQVPTGPDMMHKVMLEKFESQEADADFDRDFMQQMVRDHQAVVELFEKTADDSQVDADFQALARKMLPTLREHLKSAQMLEAKTGKDQ